MPSKPPSLADRPLIRNLRAALRELADPEKAPIIQAYMKSSMPCLGVQTPLHRAACREVFAAHPLASPEAWRDTVLALWREAEVREDRHAAINLTGYRAYRAYQRAHEHDVLEPGTAFALVGYGKVLAPMRSALRGLAAARTSRASSRRRAVWPA